MGLAAKRDFSVSSTAYSSFATPIPIALGEVPDAPTAYAGFRLAAEVAVVVVVAADFPSGEGARCGPQSFGGGVIKSIGCRHGLQCVQGFCRRLAQ